MSSTCATTTTSTIFFLLLAMAASTFCLQNPNPIQLALDSVLLATNWVQTSMELHKMGSNSTELSTNVANYASVALTDCAKLYEESVPRLIALLSGENYASEDARTWLSGVLANHRSCLDGLEEKEVVKTDHPHDVVAQNLTMVLGEALSFYGNEGVNKGMRVEPRPRGQQSHPKQINGGMLVSWSPATSRADFVVAKDGSGSHTTINDALAALAKMGHGRPRRVIIYVKAGVYNEKVDIRDNMKNLMFVGDGMDKTIVTGSRNVPDGATTLSSATFGVSGDGFWARDMTFENTVGPQKHQAVALRVSSDLSVFYSCSIKAYQDTLYVHSLRQFYRDCHVYGTVDFIFGDASAVFQNCDIFVRRPMSHQANIITAQGRDHAEENTGIAIHGCRVRPAPEFAGVKGSFRSYLGRPWKKYSRTVVMKTDMDGLVDPKGWTEWSGSFALSTLFYGEYMNMGVGAATERRVRWAGFHVLRAEEIGPFTVGRFIQGEGWISETGVPFWTGV